MKKIFVAVAAFSCLAWNVFAASHAEELRARLDGADRNYVFVTMHRGDWRNAPENSSAAILGSIEKGADIVELDVAKTKDGHFVLLHDGALDRVSNGKGRSTDLTLAEIKEFRLKDDKGNVTEYPILSLEEAFALTKGKILVNLDKFWRDPKGVLKVAKKCGVEREIILKDNASVKEAKKKYSVDFWADMAKGDLFYMPIISTDKENAVEHFREWRSIGAKCGAYEIIFNKESDNFRTVIGELGEAQKSGGPRIWINTLWSSLCAEHTDDRGAKGDTAGSWKWCLDQGATMLQTDRPVELIKYLKSIDRR